MKQITERLRSGQDLRREIERMARENKIEAGCILSVVGSLEKAVLRMPGGEAVKNWDEPLEIVSGAGTLSADDLHIHIAVSDREGRTFGGHLKNGCIVRTTAEVVILSFDGVKYKRSFDKETGYDELEIKDA